MGGGGGDGLGKERTTFCTYDYLWSTYNSFLMPATKLTLRLDAELIGRGKAHAKTLGTSLSKMVEDMIHTAVAGELEVTIPEHARDPDAPWGIARSPELDCYVSEKPHDPGDPYADRIEYYEYLTHKHDL